MTVTTNTDSPASTRPQHQRYNNRGKRNSRGRGRQYENQARPTFPSWAPPYPWMAAPGPWSAPLYTWMLYPQWQAHAPRQQSFTPQQSQVPNHANLIEFQTTPFQLQVYAT